MSSPFGGTIYPVIRNIPELYGSRPDDESARKIGDRVALLYGGKILYDAPPDEFLKSSDPAVRQFVEGKAKGPLTVESQVSEGA